MEEFKNMIYLLKDIMGWLSITIITCMSIFGGKISVNITFDNVIKLWNCFK